MTCIDINSIFVKELSEQLNLKPVIVGAKIAIWQEKNNTYEIPSASDLAEGVNYSLTVVNTLASDKAKQVFEKGNKNKWSLDKILTELQVPKEQKKLVIDSYNNLMFSNDEMTIEPTLEEIITDLLANYSYTVEINTATEKSFDGKDDNNWANNNIAFINGIKYVNHWSRGWVLDKDNSKISEEILSKIVELQSPVPTQHYSNLSVPGGTAYSEQEIATPAITPSIKGHAQFATDKGIGWFRSDDKVNYTMQDIDKLIQILENSKQLIIDCE